jgi:hypothetical protein
MEVREEQSENALGDMLTVPSLMSIEVLVGILPLYSYKTLLIYTMPSGMLLYHGVL